MSTTIFLNKPVAFITASADGQRGHTELRLIMQTLGARLSGGIELIIPGIKSKLDDKGWLKDTELVTALTGVGSALQEVIKRPLGESEDSIDSNPPAVQCIIQRGSE